MVTHPGVVPRLMNGADLFLPGVIMPSEGFGVLKVGQKRAIKVNGNGLIVGVGTSSVDTKMIKNSGLVGVGLEILHRYGDHLFLFGPSHLSPETLFRLSHTDEKEVADLAEGSSDQKQLNGEQLCEALGISADPAQFMDSQPLATSSDPDGTCISSPDLDALAKSPAEKEVSVGSRTAAVAVFEGAEVHDLEKGNHDDLSDRPELHIPHGAKSSAAEPKPEVADGKLEKEEEQEQEEEEEEAKEEKEESLTPGQMDELLELALLFALKTSVTDSVLPLDPSELLSKHMLHCNPTRFKLDAKLSTYKQMAKFLKEMSKRGWLSLKEKKQGPMVTVVNRASRAYVDFALTPDLLAKRKRADKQRAKHCAEKAREKETLLKEALEPPQGSAVEQAVLCLLHLRNSARVPYE
jgi:hypothetical protein